MKEGKRRWEGELAGVGGNWRAGAAIGRDIRQMRRNKSEKREEKI